MKKKKAIFAAVLAIGLLFGTAEAIVDAGDPAVSRLWSMGGKFTCSATYVRPLRQAGAWVLTAGHCADNGQVLGRNTNTTVKALVNWRVVVTSHSYAGKVQDFAVGTVPDTRENRKYYSFFDETPLERGATVYIHGFPGGVERITRAVVGPALVNGPPGVVTIYTKTPGEITYGSSGSVVLNADGRIVGIVWGIRVEGLFGEQETNTVFITPIAPVLAALKAIEAEF